MQTLKHNSIAFLKRNKEVLRVVLAVCMVVAGTLHFLVPDPFVKIVPAPLPEPEIIVYVSGIFEILGGLGLLVPPVSRRAAWGLIAIFILVFPANLNMAFNDIHIDGIPDGWWFQAIRLPFQAVLIAWAYWYTGFDDNPDRASILPRFPKSDRS
ncbi:DoxX family membrane protein [Geitlerinema sp. CS-897]|nr:DoxX family membrane protein [Geitlerinema sp. CS-897]